MSRPRSDTNPNDDSPSPRRQQQRQHMQDHPSVRALDAATVDKIAAAAVSRGGSDDLVRDQLLHATVRRSHNPLPVVDPENAPLSPQGGAVPIASARKSTFV